MVVEARMVLLLVIPYLMKKGNFLGCTMCENEDGKCHSESSPVSSTTANNILSALMNAIKLNLNIGL